MRNWINLFEDTRENVLYHGSIQEIERPYRPLTHFGTRTAALTRGAFQANKNGQCPVWLHAAIINIRHPLRIEDIDFHSTVKLADWLHYDHQPKNQRISAQHRDLILKTVADQGEGVGARILARILKDMGYDGIVYTNRHEDRGSDSYILLSDDQIEVSIRGYPIDFQEVVESLE